MSSPGTPPDTVLTMETALNGIELCQVMDVLGAEIIAGAELALLLLCVPRISSATLTSRVALLAVRP
jgi:hypothetical protein